jgi:hypothetical protein
MNIEESTVQFSDKIETHSLELKKHASDNSEKCSLAIQYIQRKVMIIAVLEDNYCIHAWE